MPQVVETGSILQLGRYDLRKPTNHFYMQHKYIKQEGIQIYFWMQHKYIKYEGIQIYEFKQMMRNSKVYIKLRRNTKEFDKEQK